MQMCLFKKSRLENYTYMYVNNDKMYVNNIFVLK